MSTVNKKRVGIPRLEWINRLSSEAKAEILSSVLHQLEPWENPKVWAKLPKKLQKLILRAQADCFIWYADLSPKDYRDIGKWFRGA